MPRVRALAVPCPFSEAPLQWPLQLGTSAASHSKTDILQKEALMPTHRKVERKMVRKRCTSPWLTYQHKKVLKAMSEMNIVATALSHRPTASSATVRLPRKPFSDYMGY